MSQFKRFNASENTNWDTNFAHPEGTLTWDPSNGLRLHDGYTSGGYAVGSSNYYDLSNRPNGSTAVHDLIGGSSSDNNGMFLQQFATGQSTWSAVSYNSLTDKPTIPTDVNQLSDSSSLLPATQVRLEMKSSNFTAVAAKKYWVDTTAGSVTMTLPANPSVGDWVSFYDAEFKWSTNNPTVDGNGNNVRITNMAAGPTPSWTVPASTVTLGNMGGYGPSGPLPYSFMWNGSVWSGFM